MKPNPVTEMLLEKGLSEEQVNFFTSAFKKIRDEFSGAEVSKLTPEACVRSVLDEYVRANAGEKK